MRAEKLEVGGELCTLQEAEHGTGDISLSPVFPGLLISFSHSYIQLCTTNRDHSSFLRLPH